ncbi:hypothetical protein CLOM_g4634 [Closterium sp. NIES-68]|nr:hypothetical protein CLOM_g4634 [Closterium sp. NIES-68]GJP85762.1 hypothetical protein CLOP_g15861 [Closterium sp. NIES-67]
MSPSALRKLFAASTVPLGTIYSVGEGRTVVIGLDGCRDCRNAFAQWLRDGQQPDDRIVAAIAGGSRHNRSSSLTSLDAAPSSQSRTSKRGGDSGDVRQATKAAITSSGNAMAAASGKATAVVKNTVVVPGLPLEADFGDWDKKSRSTLLKLAAVGSQEKVRFEAIRLPSAGTALSFARSLVDCCHSVDAHLLLLPAHDCSALLPFLPSLPLSSASSVSALSASSASAAAIPFASADSRARRVASFCSVNAPCPVELIGRLSSGDASASGRESCGGSARDSTARKEIANFVTGAHERCSDVQDCSSSNGSSSNEDADRDLFSSSSSSGSRSSDCSTSSSPSRGREDSLVAEALSIQSQSQATDIVQEQSQRNYRGKQTFVGSFFLIRAGSRSRTSSKRAQVRQLVRRWSGGGESKREATFTSRGYTLSVFRGKDGVASVG